MVWSASITVMLLQVWNLAALGEVGGYAAPLVYLYRQPWEAPLKAMKAALNIPEAHMSHLK